MKRLAVAIAATFTAIAPAAFAQYDRYDRYDRYDNRSYAYEQRDNRDFRGERARVLETKAITDTAGQRQECWNPRAGHYEEVRGEEKTRVGKGAAIGAVAGGVVGNQATDHGTGGTIAGALIGGLIGHAVEKRHNDNNDDQTDLDRSRCRVIAEGTGDLQGYDVRYAYRGREYVARMDRDPGRTLRVGNEINSDGTPFTSAYR